MKDQHRTKPTRATNGPETIEQQLTAELAELRQRVAELEASEAECRQAKVALQESEGRFRDLYEDAPNAYFSVGADGHIIRCNKRASELLGYAVEEMIGRSVLELYADTPQGKEKASRVFQQFRAGEAVVDEEIQMQKADGAPVWINLTVSAIRDAQGQIVESRSMVTDISERVQAEVARRQAEEALRLYADRLKILHEIDQGILAAQSPEAIAQAAVTRVRQLIPCQRVGIAVLDSVANEMVTLTTDAVHAEETRIKEGARWRLNGLEDVVAALRQGRTVKWEDFQSRGETGRIVYADGLHSIVSVPLVSQGELIGSLNLANTDSDAFTQEYEDLARQVADQLAIAIQQAYLYEQIRRHAEELEQRVTDRTRELSVLYEVASLASQSPDLEMALARSLKRVLETVKSEAGTIHLLDEVGARLGDTKSGDGTSGEEILDLAVRRGIPPDLAAQIESLPVSTGLGKWMVEHDEPLIMPDMTSDPRTTGILPAEPCAYVGMPLRAGGRTVGVLSIVRRVDQPRLSLEEISLLTSVADQLGIMVQSAWLRKRAERAAVLEERGRLARELHDSITQSLYSLTLFAEAGREFAQAGEWERARQHLVWIGEAALQSLKEMRLLVYELRLPTLEREGLVSALQQRLDAVEGRANVKARLLAEELPSLPGPVEEGLYRIAQEALNNALKHAAATSVTIHIRPEGEGEAQRVNLEVVDDGVGFDSATARDRGGAGLINMRQRVEGLGGGLTILSAPGEGTRIKVSVEMVGAHRDS